jgi:hypothetical protein
VQNQSAASNDGLITHHISRGGQLGDCLWLSHSELDILGHISRRDLLMVVMHLCFFNYDAPVLGWTSSDTCELICDICDACDGCDINL